MENQYVSMLLEIRITHAHSIKVVWAVLAGIVLQVINAAATSMLLLGITGVCHKHGRLFIRFDSDKNQGGGCQF